jgi:HAD superfamily hydrolase (TIGR01509 family)
MKTSSVVVFDLGKVLVDFDYSIAAKRIAAHSARPAAEIKSFIDQTPLLLDYEAGRVTRLEFFERVRAATGFRGTIEEFGRFFADIFTPIPPMIELHAELRRQKIPTCVFSNTNDLAIEHIRRSFPFFADFDGCIFSYEVGALKPQPEIYEAVEKMSGRRGGEIIYIDDRLENVEAGSTRGWKTILHESPEKTRAALQKILPF